MIELSRIIERGHAIRLLRWHIELIVETLYSARVRHNACKKRDQFSLSLRWFACD